MLYGNLHLLNTNVFAHDRFDSTRLLDFTETIATDFQIEQKITICTDALGGVRWTHRDLLLIILPFDQDIFAMITDQSNRMRRDLLEESFSFIPMKHGEMITWRYWSEMTLAQNSVWCWKSKPESSTSSISSFCKWNNLNENTREENVRQRHEPGLIEECHDEIIIVVMVDLQCPNT